MIRTFCVLLLLGLAACSAPDTPEALIDPLPTPLLEWMQPDSLRAARLSPGVVYRYVWSGRGPWAVHLVEADLGLCALGLEVVAAPSDPDIPGGRSTVSDMVANHPRRAIAAINGDFFTPEGFPLGPEVSGGVVRIRRSRPALVFEGGRIPYMGTTGVTRLEGAEQVSATSWLVTPTELGGIQMIGGYPELLDEGLRVGDLGIAGNPGFAAARQPRTAVGYDQEAGRLWLAVVDGRQGEYSTGMSLPELAQLFEALGVGDALNLDGGGSSVLVLNGKTANRPSDAAGERPVVNALLLVHEPGFCQARKVD